jgi:hypothetical protein
MTDYISIETSNKPLHEKLLSEKTGIILSCIALAVILVGIIIFLKYGSWDASKVLDESKMGEFGDFIGGIAGTLVALVGVILYYVALTEQRNEIKINQQALNLQINALNHQITEFQAQKEELISTRKIYEQQTKTMRNQQFDSNFYSLLNVYLSIKNNLNENDVDHDFFFSFYNELFASVTKTYSDTFHETYSKVIENYTNVYLKHRGQLSSYFKTIYRLLKFVDECEHLQKDEKSFYSKIIRSQISDNELLVLYYNYHSIYGVKAQSLVLKYQLLKHIQRLSKIEFSKHFTFSDDNKKNQIILFTEWFVDLLSKNIDKAKDIETPPIIVQELYKGYNVIVGINIDVSLEIKLVVKDDVLSNLPFEETTFSEYINLVIYDYYSLEKFQKCEQSTIHKSITKENKTTIFKYTIENL